MIFEKEYSHCKSNQKIIVSSENGKIHTAKNNNGCIVYHYHIDGEIVKRTDSKQRCDYALENETTHKLYLIELKGTHVLKAIEQIESTISLFNDEFSGYIICPRIIYKSNSHSVNTSKQRKFKSKYKEAIIKEKIYTEEI